MHIVLVEPEIPQNTGNIVRTCVLTDTTLHLVKPIGFSLEDRYLKRAGLDYWDKLKIHIWNNYGEFLQHFPNNLIYLATTKASGNYAQTRYNADDIIVFGSESKGLSENILASNVNKIRIPMLDFGRSLNLSNAVAIVLYEALRQHNFSNFQ